MKFTNKELDDLMVELVRKNYGATPFARRDLMDLTKDVVSELGRWEDEDDLLSGSKGKKSRGLAHIDYRFTPLKLSGQLLHIAHGFWMLSTEAVSLPQGKLSPAKKLVLEWRIIRDTSVVTALKKL